MALSATAIKATINQFQRVTQNNDGQYKCVFHYIFIDHIYKLFIINKIVFKRGQFKLGSVMKDC